MRNEWKNGFLSGMLAGISMSCYVASFAAIIRAELLSIEWPYYLLIVLASVGYFTGLASITRRYFDKVTPPTEDQGNRDEIGHAYAFNDVDLPPEDDLVWSRPTGDIAESPVTSPVEAEPVPPKSVDHYNEYLKHRRELHRLEIKREDDTENAAWIRDWIEYHYDKLSGTEQSQADVAEGDLWKQA